MLLIIRRVALAGALVALTTAPVLAEEAVDTLAREDAIEAQVDAETANQNALQAQQDAAQAQGNAAQAQQGVSDVAGELHGLAARLAYLESLLVPGGTMPNPNVECNSFTVQDVIDSATGPITITIFGICDEDVLIEKDDITLRGNATLRGDGIQGEITIVGARRTKIENMTISGGVSGITAYDGAVLRATNLTVKETTGKEGYNGYGVGSYQGAVVVLTNVDVRDTSGYSVQAGINGMVEIRGGSGGSEILNDSNVDSAVHAFDSSFVRISGDVTVESTRGTGVYVSQSTVRILKDSSGTPSITSTSTDEEAVAVFIHKGSNARIEDATLSATSGRALMIHSGSNASVRRSAISSGNPFETVLVIKGSSIELSNNTITNDATSPGDGAGSGTAVQVVNDSSIAFYSRAGSPGNTLTTGGTAVGVNYASHVQQNGKRDTFNGKIDIFGSSSAQFMDAAINGDMEVSQDSWLRLRNQSTSSDTEVTGNINLWADSLLSFQSPIDETGTPVNKVLVTGSVNCDIYDDESSYTGASKAIVTGGFSNCTGFSHTH